MIVDHFIKYFLLKLMKFRVFLLKFLLVFLLLGYIIETHAYFLISIYLEIQKVVWVLQLCQIAFDILPVLDILC